MGDIYPVLFSAGDGRKNCQSDGVLCGKGGGYSRNRCLDGDFVVGFYTRVQQVGQGIGKLLMTHLEEYARDKGFATLQLAASPVGVTFYYKHGWKKVNDVTLEYYGVAFQETLMIKML